MENVEKRAAETILEKGVRVKLPAPFLLRLLFIRKINWILKQPNSGALLHFSTEMLDAKIDLATLKDGNLSSAHQMVVDHTMPVCRMLAYIFLRSKWKIRLFTRWFADYLLWQTTATRKAEIALLIVAFGRIEDFTSTIRLLMAMKMTTPKNLSPDEKGS